MSPQCLHHISCCLLLLFLSSPCQASDNTTDNLLRLDEDQLMKGRFLGLRKTPRFLSFTTIDNTISIEMQLSVPFLTIPVKKTVDAATGLVNHFPPANINLAAIGLAGAVVGGAVFVLPNLLKLFSHDDFEHTHFKGVHEHWSRSGLSRALEAGGAPPSACAERALCALVRRAKEADSPTSMDKIVDGLATSKWLQDYFHGTIVTAAITSGYGEESCSSLYPQCKISHTALQNLAKILFNNILGNK